MESLPVLAFGLFMAALIVGIGGGGGFLWLAVWLFNELSQPKNQSPILSSEKGEERVLKTTDAGPYTAPGVESAPPPSHPAPQDSPTPIAQPSYPFACWVTFCMLVALGICNAVVQESLFSLDRRGMYYLIHYSAVVVPSVLFCVATLVHMVFLATTPWRATLITLMLIVPWGATGIAVAAICLYG